MRCYRLVDLNQQQQEKLCQRNPITDTALLETCHQIFNEVQRRGDQAVREYTRIYDGVQLSTLQVGRGNFSQAGKQLSKRGVSALEMAAQNIRKFHANQQLCESQMEVQSGVWCWRESRAIDSVGLYIPGGTAVLPSTVLMLGIPAQLAGCRRVVLCVPPRADGSVSAEVLVAAKIAGIKAIYRMGGAQAIAAMALGTETVPRVEKILGPGSRVVQAAKLVAFLKGVAIDMVAGPSEVLIIADRSARSAWVASDLISQAEHGSDSCAILVTDSPQLVQEVNDQLRLQLKDLPRKHLATQALRKSFAMLTESLDEAFSFSNLYAPEHLILQVEDPQRWLEKVNCGGSVFLGPWSPEVAGDYASGTNHTLPTSRMARAFSGVSMDTFVKKITFQELNRQGLIKLAPTLEALAELEGLEGHRRAVQIRIKLEAL